MKSKSRIFLTGFSGAGKSTVGEVLAKRLKVRFYDTDRMISRKAGKSISRIFSENGESYFRTLESEVIAGVIANSPNRSVVALGGGAYQSKTNRKMIDTTGVVVYLRCAQRELFRRLRQMEDRPLLASRGRDLTGGAEALKERIRKLMEKRRRTYESANITVSTTGKTVKQTIRELTGKMNRFYENN